MMCGEVNREPSHSEEDNDGNTRPPDQPPEKPVCRSGSKLELDMEQQTGSK